jgi:hypothetical protein
MKLTLTSVWIWQFFIMAYKFNMSALYRYMMYFVKIDQLWYPNMTTALQTCYNINADWHTFILEAIAFPLF